MVGTAAQERREVLARLLGGLLRGATVVIGADRYEAAPECLMSVWC